MKLLNKIKKHLKRTNEEAIKEEYYMPKLFGESKSVEYEIDGLAKSYCKVTEWANGEGYDISFQTEENTNMKSWETKSISLHTDELDCFLACLNHLKYFKR